MDQNWPLQAKMVHFGLANAKVQFWKMPFWPQWSFGPFWTILVQYTFRQYRGHSLDGEKGTGKKSHDNLRQFMTFSVPSPSSRPLLDFAGKTLAFAFGLRLRSKGFWNAHSKQEGPYPKDPPVQFLVRSPDSVVFYYSCSEFTTHGDSLLKI